MPRALLTLTLLLAGLLAACDDDGSDRVTSRDPVPPGNPAAGREIFRFDTFGNERFWTDTLRLHEVIQSSVDPLTALAIGLKVDADALPPGILDEVDLEDPATTVALLELDAVVGLQAQVANGTIQRIGITCALCHSDVDDSVQEGIGRRIDGYPNRD
ncbi:MAG TPA: hypothetical protein VFH69_04220, partial [Gemmatimonadota bacterium]|nr:hypothetical protein [Gemmatimonadota bacterium]